MTGSAAATDLTPAEIRTTISRFLARYVDDPAILDGGRLLTGGMLDSLAAVELIAHLERRFCVQVCNEDLEIENFDSIDAVTALVLRKLAR
jgi:acyl carrier protein